MIALAWPWPSAREPHERLREHVVQAVAGRVDHVAGQQRAERERVAVGLLAAASAPSSRAPSWAASVATGLASGVHGPSTAWPSALSALAASSASGCEAESVGVVDHHRAGARSARAGRRPRRGRWMRVISAPDSVVGTAIATCVPPLAAASALADVDHAAAAERHDPVARDRAEQLAGQLVDVAGAEHVHDRARASTTPGAIAARALGGQQRVALAAERLDRARRSTPRPKRIVRSPSCQVKPLRHGTLISRCSQAARNGSTIRTSPRSRATSSSRSSASTARWTVEAPGQVVAAAVVGRQRPPRLARQLGRAAAAAPPTRAPTAARSARARSAARSPARPSTSAAAARCSARVSCQAK